MLNFTLPDANIVLLHFKSLNDALQYWKQTVTKDCKSINNAELNDKSIRIYPLDRDDYMLRHNIRNLCWFKKEPKLLYFFLFKNKSRKASKPFLLCVSWQVEYYTHKYIAILWIFNGELKCLPYLGILQPLHL